MGIFSRKGASRERVEPRIVAASPEVSSHWTLTRIIHGREADKTRRRCHPTSLTCSAAAEAP
jgi:hypothetical protein